jgi:hypothetical protein
MVKYFNHIPQYITSYEENTYDIGTVYIVNGYTTVRVGKQKA